MRTTSWQPPAPDRLRVAAGGNTQEGGAGGQIEFPASVSCAASGPAPAESVACASRLDTYQIVMPPSTDGMIAGKNCCSDPACAPESRPLPARATSCA